MAQSLTMAFKMFLAFGTINVAVLLLQGARNIRRFIINGMGVYLVRGGL